MPEVAHAMPQHFGDRTHLVRISCACCLLGQSPESPRLWMRSRILQRARIPFRRRQPALAAAKARGLNLILTTVAAQCTFDASPTLVSDRRT
uniref:Uncharacterized protein n=1 Tax=Arundo donax TaxID=35708 RepID=A0A0A9BEH6_ARUDO